MTALRTLAGLLRARAGSTSADAPAIRFRDGDDWAPAWSWAEYWRQARSAASSLSARGVRPGDRVLVLVPEPEPCVRTVFGLWILGAVPVQVGVPYRLTNVAAFLADLRALADRLSARALVVSPMFAAFASADEGLPVIPAPDGSTPPAADLPDPEAARAPALIQLTSGSTGISRGVVVPHERLTLHMDCMSRALPSHERSMAVSWLPLHHDMGLIGGLLFPFYNGFTAHMLSPLDFRRSPLSWLETMHRFGGTICAAPPSAYAMCLRLADRAAAAGLDLSAWECAMVGAEPISADLLRRFSAAFAPCGFRGEAFFPVYGLAEATVAVTFPTLLEATQIDRVQRDALEMRGVAVPDPGPDALELVGCGSAIPETEIRVVDAAGGEVPERSVGEVLFRSASMMAEYYGDPSATAEAIDAAGWMHTGDLGYLADGHLHITGRLKEIIIKGGRNLMPSLLETITATVDGVRAGCVVAVGVRDPRSETEKVHVVAETRTTGEAREALAVAVRGALGDRGIFVDRVTLVRPGALPKTTSGKLRRRAVAVALAEGRPIG